MPVRWNWPSPTPAVPMLFVTIAATVPDEVPADGIKLVERIG